MTKTSISILLAIFLISSPAFAAGSNHMVKGSKSYQSRSIPDAKSNQEISKEQIEKNSPDKIEPAAGAFEDQNDAKQKSVSKLQERMMLPRKN